VPWQEDDQILVISNPVSDMDVPFDEVVSLGDSSEQNAKMSVIYNPVSELDVPFDGVVSLGDLFEQESHSTISIYESLVAHRGRSRLVLQAQDEKTEYDEDTDDVLLNVSSRYQPNTSYSNVIIAAKEKNYCNPVFHICLDLDECVNNPNDGICA
jgi:enoyl reductase-like protein